MEEILLDNPASRLLSILQEIEENCDPGETRMGVDFLAGILNVSKEPEVLLPAYAHLLVLAKDVHSAIDVYYPKEREYFQPVVTIIADTISGISPYLHSWEQLKSKILDGEVLKLSSLASALLSRHISPAPRDDLSMAALKEQFQDLKQQILNEEKFSDQLKQFLIEQLQEMLNGLDHFDLYGAAPIRKALYNITSNTDLAKKSGYLAKSGFIAFLLAVALQTPSFINDVAEMPQSIEDLKEIFFDDPKLPITPKTPFLPTALPTALPNVLKLYLADRREAEAKNQGVTN